MALQDDPQRLITHDLNRQQLREVNPRFYQQIYEPFFARLNSDFLASQLASTLLRP